jgi:hypothetical protein
MKFRLKGFYIVTVFSLNIQHTEVACEISRRYQILNLFNTLYLRQKLFFHFSEYNYCHVLVIRQRVWIGNWIYWKLVTRNYIKSKSLTDLYTLLIITEHTNSVCYRLH